MRNARWYVYELIDPRDGLAFYVGKGCGNRIHAHEREAQKDVGVCSEKINKIKDIWAAGLEVERRFIAFFWDEQAAYDFEDSRVAEYGLEALTNIVPGGGAPRGAFIRREPVAKPWGAMDAVAQLVSSKSGNALYWFAFWLKTGGKNHGLTGNKFALAVLEGGFKSLFPSAWELIRSSREALDKIAPHLREHGVELRYGSP